MKWNKPPPKKCFPPPKFFIPLDWIPDGMTWNVEYRWVPGQSRWNLFQFIEVHSTSMHFNELE